MYYNPDECAYNAFMRKCYLIYIANDSPVAEVCFLEPLKQTHNVGVIVQGFFCHVIQ